MKSNWLFNRCAVPALLAVLLCGDILAATEGRLFRYRDADGKTVISTSIPPELAAKGYEILNANGRVLETVPAHKPLTDAEKAEQSRLQSQQDEDRFLLSSYSSVEGIEAAKERKLESLNREIALIEDNLKSTRELRNKEERRAANFQRGGRPVPDSLLNTLKELERKEQEARTVLEQRRAECESEEKRYQHYIERYRELTQESSQT